MVGLAGARRQDIPVWFVILLFVTIIVLPTLMSASTVHAQDSRPKILTDKEDYSPGDTVIISGSGFNFNAIIRITVTRPPDSSNVIRIDGPYEVQSDSSGSFTYNYALDGILGTYTVEATDGTNTATTTFTDATTISCVPSPTTVDTSTTCTVSGVGSNRPAHVNWYDASSTLQFSDACDSGSCTSTHAPGSAGSWSIKLVKDSDSSLKASATLQVDGDTTAPTVTCGSPDSLWHASDQSVSCTASDGGSGLANPADAIVTDVIL